MQKSLITCLCTAQRWYLRRKISYDTHYKRFAQSLCRNSARKNDSISKVNAVGRQKYGLKKNIKKHLKLCTNTLNIFISLTYIELYLFIFFISK